MPLETSLPSSITDSLVARLGGAAPVRPIPTRPVHVVYGGAHLFKAGTIAKLGERARSAMDTWAGPPPVFAETVGVTDEALADEVTRRVRAKLAARPIEAMCIDFEDGYGPRPDAEEDAEAVRAATELAKAAEPGTLVGIRIKALAGLTVSRAVRTLDLFVTALAKGGALREGFTVTLPKVTAPEQVDALIDTLERLEGALGLARPIGVELMIESPEALRDGVARLVTAGRGRVVAVHLGAYDLTADLGVTAGDQRLDHPYCDLARMLLRLGVAGKDVGVSDGATTVLPIPPKDASDAAEAVRRAWRLHAANVRRAIELGIFQGWDLHPAQLPARYGALFGFFLAQRESMTARLRSFVEHATQASRVGQVFDDAATGQGLMSFFARGVACGALDESDVTRCGLSPSDLARSFAEIVVSRSV